MEVRQKYASKFITGEVLDIGCGDGKLLDAYCGVGLEINPTKAENAKSKGHEVYSYNIDTHPFEGLPNNPGKRFPTVVMTDVIEHFEDPVKILKHIRKNQMTYNGRLIITTPNVDWLFWKVYAKLGGSPHAWTNPDHAQLFTQKTIIKTLKKAGFTKFRFNSYGKIPQTNIHFKTPFQFLACNIVVEAK